MCGITGIYALTEQPIQETEIAAQTETLVHRGPNQGAIYRSGRKNCALGIRRLSIIDVAGGSQPLSNEDGSIRLVYNGETYNHTALRTELEQLGHRFQTYTDGEVIIHGYEAWGAAGVLKKIRGMGAFALWDERRQQLLLGRDRFGIKPLYYAEHAGRLYFASEIKAILADPTFPRRVNLAGLEALFHLGFVPGPATMFTGIYKLPPAHYLLVKDETFTISKYWQLNYQPGRSITEHEAAEQFLSLLRESVGLRLMSEVPLGALLSGGLDSGALTALVQSLLTDDAPSPQRLKSVSIGFESALYDESALAQDLSQILDTDHHPLTFEPGDFDDYPTVMRHLEEPQCSATAVPIYKLYQACQQAGLTVVLTGEGADELLGGYHWHRGDALVRPLLFLPKLLRQAIAASPLSMSSAARRVLARGAKDAPTRYQDWLDIGGHPFQPALLSAEVKQAFGENGSNLPLIKWADKLAHLSAPAPLHQAMWLESQTRLVDFINFEVDKMSMAHSIEARVPFLDHKLWEFCAGLPPHFKLRGRTEKYLLRQATRGLLPPATRTRRKKGLAAPYAGWLRAERLPDWAEEALSAETLRQSALFEPDVVQKLRRAHQQGQPNLGPLLMGVLSTQVWMAEFKVSR